MSKGPQLNMKVPHDVIMERLGQIGYHDSSTSPKALADLQTIIVNLRLGKMMVSRRMVGASGTVGLFTYFKKV